MALYGIFLITLVPLLPFFAALPIHPLLDMKNARADLAERRAYTRRAKLATD